MLKPNSLLLSAFLLALAGCGTQPLKPEPAPPKIILAPQVTLPAIPPELMVPRPANFQSRLSAIFEQSDSNATTPPSR